jgi:hypothetical protein
MLIEEIGTRNEGLRRQWVLARSHHDETIDSGLMEASSRVAVCPEWPVASRHDLNSLEDGLYLQAAGWRRGRSQREVSAYIMLS